MTAIHPQLSHCGIFARDVQKLLEFYSRILGLVVSDRGSANVAGGAELAFMTASPEHHHQFVLVSGRAPEGVTTVNQLSFKVKDLDQVKEIRRRVKEAGMTEIRQVTHGNALSIYFPDPEGNRVEVYCDTPWYVPQPHAEPVDFDRSNEEIMADLERHCRATPGFLPLAEWKRHIEDRLYQG